jgi:hypothetical protein
MSYAAAADDADVLPTARNIKEQLKSITEDCRREDSVLVAFIGQGVQFAGSKEHHLCPIDAELGEKETLVPLSDVYKELGKCKAAIKLAVIDATYPRPQAGASVKLEAKPKPQEIEVPKGVLALFSCSAGQFSFESTQLEQGIFSHYLLKGMAGSAAGKDGPITAASLVAYLQNEVPDAAKEAGGPTARQTPLLRGEKAETVALFTRPVTVVVGPPPSKGTPLTQSGPLKGTVQNEEGIIRFPTPYIGMPKVRASNRYFTIVEVTPVQFKWRHLDNTPSTGNWIADGMVAAGAAGGPLFNQTGMVSATVLNEMGQINFPVRYAAPPTVTFSNRYFVTVEVTATGFRYRHVDNTPSTANWTARGPRGDGVMPKKR